MLGLANDLRLTLRRFRQNPTFTLAIVLTLALGIGATTAIFSLVEGVLLRPLPFKDPDRLVLLGEHLGGRPGMSVRARRNRNLHRLDAGIFFSRRLHHRIVRTFRQSAPRRNRRRTP